MCTPACGKGSKDDNPKPEPKPASLVDRIDAALTRGGEFLMGQQDDGGAIRSKTYGAFKDGYSLTPLSIAAFRFAPETTSSKSAYARGVDYIATMIGSDGSFRNDLDAPKYPQYSIAIGVLVLNAPGNERHRSARDALVAELERRQLPSGGWGYDDRTANLSATLYAIGALALTGTDDHAGSLEKAKIFVERCQGDDGGFFFSPDVPDGNKAGALDVDGGRPQYRSYGSMTADGVRALLRLGYAPTHDRVRSAGDWLTKHFDPKRNPGDFPEIAEVRRESAYYYYVWSAAHALRALGRIDWAKPLATELLSRQGADGSWANGFTEMREDDPIVATSFAVAALAVARIAITGEHRSHAAPRR